MPDSTYDDELKTIAIQLAIDHAIDMYVALYTMSRSSIHPFYKPDDDDYINCRADILTALDTHL
jgi:hypothetical protein